MRWTITYYSDAVQKGVFAIAPGFVARFLRYADRLEEYGPDLGLPHTRPMGEGLFELRLKSDAGIARVFYCTLANRRIKILHHFIKKSEKTPPKEIATARRRMKEVKNAES